MMAPWEGCMWQVTAGPVLFFLLSQHSSERQAVVVAAPLAPHSTEPALIAVHTGCQIPQHGA